MTTSEMAEYPKLTFDEETHTYTYWWTPKRSEIFSSVTQVLSDTGLSEDFGAIPDIDMDWYGDRGTKIHLACHLYDLDDLVMESVHPEIKGYLDAYINAKHTLSFTTLQSEKQVIDLRRKYAGTLDKEVLFLGGDYHKIPGGEKAVIDLKSGQPHISHGYQLAAYAQALNCPTHARYGLYLRKDGTFKFKQYTELSDFTVFNSALNVHLAKRGN